MGLLSSSLLAEDEDTLDERRARLEQMSDAEKTHLLGKKKKFDALDKEEKEKYRDLHRDLVAQPDYDRLQATLQRYAEWLKSLPMSSALNCPSCLRMSDCSGQ